MLELLPTMILSGISIFLTYRLYIITKALQHTLGAQMHMQLAMEALQGQLMYHQQIFDQIVEMEKDEEDQWNEALH